LLWIGVGVQAQCCNWSSRVAGDARRDRGIPTKSRTWDRKILLVSALLARCWSADHRSDFIRDSVGLVWIPTTSARVTNFEVESVDGGELNQVPSPIEARVLGVCHRLICCPSLTSMASLRIVQCRQVQQLCLRQSISSRSLVLLPSGDAGKSSLTFLILLVISIWVIASGRLQKWRDSHFCDSRTDLSGDFDAWRHEHGISHILPVYIFLAILSQAATSVLIKNRRKLAVAVVLCCCFRQSL